MEVTYAVQYHPQVVNRDIPGLDAATKSRVKAAIEEKLMTHPEIFGVPLRQSLKGHRKLRVGDYRIVFKLKGRNIYILAIMHRSVIYQEVDKRL